MGELYSLFDKVQICLMLNEGLAGQGEELMS